MEAYLIVLSGLLFSGITWFLTSRYYRLQIRLAYERKVKCCVGARACCPEIFD